MHAVNGRAVLAVCCGSIFVVGLDATTLNIALPVLQRDLHASVTSVQWAIAGYTLVVACLLMSSGATSERLGRRATFQLGLFLFLAGSLSCSVAQSVGWLIAARMVQAVGGSMMNPVAMSIISSAFPDPQERGRAIGWWVGTAGVSMAAGPILGGLLVDTAGWRAIFLINVPICAGAIVLTERYVPPGKAERPRSPDLFGQLLMACGLALLVFGLIEAPRRGWTSPLILLCLFGTAVLLSCFVLHELRMSEPLLEPRLLRTPRLSGAIVVILLAYTILGGFLFLSPLYLEDARGYTALGAGAAVLPAALLIALAGPVSGRLAGRGGPRRWILLGCTCLTASGLLIGLFGETPGSSQLAVAYVLLGLGLGCINPAAQNALMSGMASHVSTGAALASTARQLSQSLGVAIIGSLIASEFNAASPKDSVVRALQPSWLVFAGCGVAAFFVAAATIRSPRPRAVLSDARPAVAES